jgi:hypothetical protein
MEWFTEEDVCLVIESLKVRKDIVTRALKGIDDVWMWDDDPLSDYQQRKMSYEHRLEHIDQLINRLKERYEISRR